MPAKVSEPTCQKAEPRLSRWEQTVLALKEAFSSWAKVRQLGIWLVIALVVTTGLGAAANRWARELNSDVPSGKSKKKPAQTDKWDSSHTSWWEPSPRTEASDEQAPTISTNTHPAVVQNSPASVPAAPVNSGVRNSPGVGLDNQFAPIGSKSTQTSFATPRWFGTGVSGAVGGRFAGNPIPNRHIEKSNKVVAQGSSPSTAVVAFSLQGNSAGQLKVAAPNPLRAPSAGTNSSSSAGSVIPVSRGTQFSGGELIVDSGLSDGGSTSREPYEILGLRTSSTPSSIPLNPVASISIEPSVLTFSLSGDVNALAVDNLASGAVNFAVIPMPEPSAGLMLSVGLAALAVTRRRPAQRRA